MADPAPNDLMLAGLNLGEGAGPPLTLESLAVGEDAVLLVRIVNLLSGPQAARLMCVNRLMKRAVLASKWPPWSPEPHILANGTVCEPLSGRYCAYICLGDDWARVCQTIADAPEGATLLMMAGDYEATKMITLSRPIYIFGNRATVRGGETMEDEPIFECSATRGALVGLSIEARRRSGFLVIYVTDGAFRLQGCTLTASQHGSGVDVSGHSTCPTIVDCKIRGGTWGCSFMGGACGALRQCDILDAGTGVFVVDFGNRSALLIEGNVITATHVGVRIHPSVDPSFTLGPGNAIHGGEQDVRDSRAGVPQPD